jgi:thiol:disulfide interchange protein/DsbC/DsbD-like thiol-disulfide interchange protein
MCHTLGKAQDSRPGLGRCRIALAGIGSYHRAPTLIVGDALPRRMAKPHLHAHTMAPCQPVGHVAWRFLVSRFFAGFLAFIPLGGTLTPWAHAQTFVTKPSASAPTRIEAVTRTQEVEAELVSAVSAFVPGEPFQVALRMKMIPHWHTYWRNPGDSGLATKIDWQLPEGWKAGPIAWPAPQRLPAGPLMNFGYENEIFLTSLITPAASDKGNTPAALTAKVDWLVCKEICIPQNGTVRINLATAGSAKAAPSAWFDVLQREAARVPGPAQGWNVTANRVGDLLSIGLRGETTATLNELTFYPYRENLIDNPAPQTKTGGPGSYQLAVKLMAPVPTDLTTLDGIIGPLKDGRFAEISVPVVAGSAAASGTVSSTSGVTPPPKAVPPPSGTPTSLWLALVFALVGGAILNLMPCVFPVLGIKVLGFVDHAHGDTRLLRAQGLLFLAGVLASFLVLAGLLLALRAGGAQLGWGFQLQSPVFVTLLAILFLLMALNLSGVYEMGMRLQTAAGSVGESRNVRLNAFLSGVLATVIATPCTAPFLGASLGYTLAQPAPVALLVFLAMGVGMAAPVTLLSFFPKALRWLPRPGAWMETFKQFMAFPLYGTVVWLAWVLGQQLGNDAVMELLAGLTLIALGAWIYGRFGLQKFAVAATGAAAIGAFGAVIAWPEHADAVAASAAASGTPSVAKAGELPWQPYSRQALADARAAGKPVFIDFTAAWCISCQVNKRVAMHNDAVVKKFAEAGVVTLKADWTRQDPTITAALAEYGRNAVPVYVLYGRGHDGTYKLLPEVLTPQLLIDEVVALGPAPQMAAVEPPVR